MKRSYNLRFELLKAFHFNLQVKFLSERAMKRDTFIIAMNILR